jgi:hypothetical protein
MMLGGENGVFHSGAPGRIGPLAAIQFGGTDQRRTQIIRSAGYPILPLPRWGVVGLKLIGHIEKRGGTEMDEHAKPHIHQVLLQLRERPGLFTVLGLRPRENTHGSQKAGNPEFCLHALCLILCKPHWNMEQIPNCGKGQKEDNRRANTHVLFWKNPLEATQSYRLPPVIPCNGFPHTDSGILDRLFAR